MSASTTDAMRSTSDTGATKPRVVKHDPLTASASVRLTSPSAQ